MALGRVCTFKEGGRGGRGEREREVQASGSCGNGSSIGTSREAPATVSVERLDKGWSEAARASPRGGGWGSDCAEKRERERKKKPRLAPANLEFDWEGPLTRGKWILDHG